LFYLYSLPMDTLRQALQGSIIELLDSIQRLKWHIEATKDEKDAQEKRVLVQLIMKERDVRISTTSSGIQFHEMNFVDGT